MSYHFQSAFILHSMEAKMEKIHKYQQRNPVSISYSFRILFSSFSVDYFSDFEADKVRQYQYSSTFSETHSNLVQRINNYKLTGAKSGMCKKLPAVGIC